MTDNFVHIPALDSLQHVEWTHWGICSIELLCQHTVSRVGAQICWSDRSKLNLQRWAIPTSLPIWWSIPGRPFERWIRPDHHRRWDGWRWRVHLHRWKRRKDWIQLNGDRYARLVWPSMSGRNLKSQSYQISIYRPIHPTFLKFSKFANVRQLSVNHWEYWSNVPSAKNNVVWPLARPHWHHMFSIIIDY